MSGQGIAGLRILLVEDEAPIAMLIEDILADAGCQIVGSVSRLSTASIAVDRGGFSFAVLDVDLAGEAVFPVAAILAERGIPFLFVTGHDRAKIALEFRDRPLLRKPFRNNELISLIERMVAPQPGNA